MSWDIFVQDLPAGARSVSEIPDGFVPGVIGTRAAIVDSIYKVVPDADFSDPTWGRIDGVDYSIEVNLGSEADCHGFALHVRGGAAAPFVVHEILTELGLRALDGMNEETGFFSLQGGSSEAFARWRAYRDQVAEPDGG